MVGASWGNVPLDLIHLLAKRMTADLADLIRLSVVSVSWRSMLIENQWLGYAHPLEALVGVSSLHLPKLMIPDPTTKVCYNSNTRVFYDWGMEKTFQVHLPETCFMYCCGSNNGWLVITDSKCNLSLLNLITREQIMLPTHCSPDKFRLTFIIKAFIIGSPSKPGDCTVAAVNNDWMILAKPGSDTVWKKVETGFTFENIAHYQGLLYGVNYILSKVEIWNLNPLQKVMYSSLATPISHKTNLYAYNTYFIEVNGEFIGVGRALEDDAAPIILKLICHGCRWEEVEDLGDCSLFLGYNSSTALSPVPPDSGFRKNCIYFCHRSHTEPREEAKCCNVLIYSLKDKLLQKVSFGEKVAYTFASSIWVRFHHGKFEE